MDRFCALDLGDKTVGIATNDSLGIVHGKENFRYDKDKIEEAVRHVADFLKKEGIANLVIGLPLQIDRKEGDRCLFSRNFGSKLIESIPELKIVYHDESYTTIEARERLEDAGLKKEKIEKIIDMVSAEVILEDYLRSKGYEE
jgi:putative Holliday junction resolvase